MTHAGETNPQIQLDDDCFEPLGVVANRAVQSLRNKKQQADTKILSSAIINLTVAIRSAHRSLDDLARILDTAIATADNLTQSKHAGRKTEQ